MEEFIFSLKMDVLRFGLNDTGVVVGEYGVTFKDCKSFQGIILYHRIHRTKLTLTCMMSS